MRDEIKIPVSIQPKREENLNVYISANNKKYIIELSRRTHQSFASVVEEILTKVRLGKLK
jgi:hypothetical protein